MNKSTRNFLKLVGVPAHLRAYEMIGDAIELVAKDRSYVHAITKRLYPSIAEKYSVTVHAVERNIRTAKEHSFKNIPPELKQDLFGSSVYPRNTTPTNAQYIATLADYLKEVDQ